MRVLITGCAGFIGMHVAKQILQRGDHVIGIDDINDYYDQSIKVARLNKLRLCPSFSFEKIDISDYKEVERIFSTERPQRVINLAAQPGVRYSLKNPHIYIQTNIVGFTNILEAWRHYNVEHLVYASSSSVYGANTQVPFSVHDNVDHPVSLYAASKKANELLAHTYSHLYGLPTTGLRYFTVYGPWGRPDMSLWVFTAAILEGRPIDIFNRGKMKRDFTYVSDIAEGTIRALDLVPRANPKFSTTNPDPASSCAPYKIYNIGNHKSVDLMEFISTLEDVLGKKAAKNFLPRQPGDMINTYADIDDSRSDLGFSPSVSLPDGLARWAEWYEEYSKVAIPSSSFVRDACDDMKPQPASG